MSNVYHYGLIAAGGAFGACLRYWLTISISGFSKSFPFGTLLVNVLGTFLLVTMYSWLQRHSLAGTELRALIGVGFLGALTTFSTFSLETLVLFEAGLWQRALLNVLLNVCLCLSAGVLAIFLFKG